MGWLDSLFGSDDPETVTSTQDARTDPIYDRIFKGISSGNGLNWIDNPQSPIVGYGPQLGAGQQYADRTMERMYDRDYGRQAMSKFGRSGQRVPVDRSSMAEATYGRAGSTALPVASQVGKIEMSDIFAGVSPYANRMKENAVKQIERDSKRDRAQVASTAAQRSAFGGSGEALGKFLANENAGDRIDDATARIDNEAFAQAKDLAVRNQNLEESAKDRFINTVFRGSQDDRAAAESADGLAGRTFDRGRQADADDLGILTTAAGLDSRYLSDMTGSVNQSLRVADIDRQLQQAIADQDWTTFNRIIGLVPGYSTRTVTTQDGGGGSFFDKAVGLGTTALGLWG